MNQGKIDYINYAYRDNIMEKSSFRVSTENEKKRIDEFSTFKSFFNS